MSEPKITVNPIDPDKVAQNPGLLPYSHSVSGPPIVPTSEGMIRHQSLETMAQQTDQQMELLRKQMELLAEQAKAIQLRREVSEWVYGAKMSFKPVINHVYHLYRNEDGSHVLSMLSPEEWALSRRPALDFVHSIRLLADLTWDVVR
ncbi:MAG: DUF2452 domain-containing protein [Schleiferiaceae bacterium]|jgi:hypothetical protein